MRELSYAIGLSRGGGKLAQALQELKKAWVDWPGSASVPEKLLCAGAAGLTGITCPRKPTPAMISPPSHGLAMARSADGWMDARTRDTP